MPRATFNLNRAVLALAHLAATDERRPALTRLWTRKGRVEAADGFIAGSVTPKSNVPDGLTIDGSVAMKALRSTTVKKPKVVAVHDSEENTVSLGAENRPGQLLVSEDVICHPPDVAALMSTDVPHAMAILNIDLLKKVLAVFDAATDPKDTGRQIEVRMFGAYEPVQFRGLSAEGDEIRVMQMPMVGNKGLVTTWVFDPVDADPTQLLKHHVETRTAQADGCPGDRHVPAI